MFANFGKGLILTKSWTKTEFSHPNSFFGAYLAKGFEKNQTKMPKLLMTKVYVETCFKSSGAHPMRLHVQMTQVCVGKCSDTAMGLPLRGNHLWRFFSLLFCVQKISYFKHVLLQPWKIAQLKKIGEIATSLCQSQFPGQCPSLRSPPKKEDFAPFISSSGLPLG